MANPRAFISFDFDHDQGSRIYFTGQDINSKTPFKIEDCSSKTELDERRWRELIVTKIKCLHLLITLVGRINTATGVHKEIEMAQRNNIPYFGVDIDNANSLSKLPLGLPISKVLAWKWDSIAEMIDQCMREGKNRSI